jgi:LysM repeat protein
MSNHVQTDSSRDLDTTYDARSYNFISDIYSYSESTRAAWSNISSSSGESRGLLDFPELQIVDSTILNDVEAAITNAERIAEEATIDVKPGDTVWAIARRALENESGARPTNQEIVEMVKAIAEMNKLDDPNSIKAGTRLQVPTKQSA